MPATRRAGRTATCPDETAAGSRSRAASRPRGRDTILFVDTTTSATSTTTPAVDRPATVAVVGAGSRGRTFAGYAETHPDRARVVAVADPRWQARRFGDWRDLATRPRVADAVILTTPDREHAAPARRFAEMGYAVLLEKPIALTPQECVDVVEAAVAAMEDSGVFNAGKGAITNRAGVVELDASIMDGRGLEAGAVASLKAVRNPISAARLVPAVNKARQRPR